MGMGTLLLSGLLLAPGAATELPADVTPIREHEFSFPVRIDPARRGQVREVELYYSVDQGHTWKRDSAVTPEKEKFRVLNKPDGLYWFVIREVYTNGQAFPADVNQAPAVVKVLIDSQPPLVRLRAERVGDEVQVQWDVQEEHPDLSSLALEYRTGDAEAWYPVQLPPASFGLAGQHRFKMPYPGPVSVRVSMRDAANNPGSEEKALPGPGTQQANFAAAPPVTPAGGPPAMPAFGPGPAAPPPGDPWATANRRPDPPAAPAPPLPVPGAPAAPPPVPPAAPAPVQTVASASPQPAPPTYVPAPPVVRAALPPPELVNTNQINLAYTIDRVGPSRVSRIELWMTPDDGRSWSKLTESSDCQLGYISALLPGEGIYGFRMVLQSGVGLSKGPPVLGEAPETRVEVDLTPPEVHLLDPTPDPKRPDTIILQWTARDSRGLEPDPIKLEWSENPDGKDWKPVNPDGRKLPNTGQYPWQIRPNSPCRVYLRLTAHDLAGNVGEDRTEKPVLIDLIRPEGKLRGVVPTLPPAK